MSPPIPQQRTPENTHMTTTNIQPMNELLEEILMELKQVNRHALPGGAAHHLNNAMGLTETAILVATTE